MTTRITGGRDRGRKLRSPKSSVVRPTSEKVRAAIFAMIGQDVVVGARVLDLYAGTGALGIEALSRGAKEANFVEAHGGLCKSILDNLRELGMAGRGRVHRSKVERGIERVKGPYDLVLADPPYNSEPWNTIMSVLETRRILSEGAVVVAEHSSKHALAEGYGSLVQWKTRRYGDTSISIYTFEKLDA